MGWKSPSTQKQPTRNALETALYILATLWHCSDGATEVFFKKCKNKSFLIEVLC